MLKYTIKRIFLALLTLWIIITITFCLMHAIPGDPFSKEKQIAPEIMAKLEANNVTQTTIGQNILGKKIQDKQMNLMEYNAVAFAQEIAQIDMDSMTPRDALNQLYLLREKARKI